MLPLLLLLLLLKLLICGGGNENGDSDDEADDDDEEEEDDDDDGAKRGAGVGEGMRGDKIEEKCFTLKGEGRNFPCCITRSKPAYSERKIIQKHIDEPSRECIGNGSSGASAKGIGSLSVPQSLCSVAALNRGLQRTTVVIASGGGGGGGVRVMVVVVVVVAAQSRPVQSFGLCRGGTEGALQAAQDEPARRPRAAGWLMIDVGLACERACFEGCRLNNHKSNEIGT